MRKPLAFLLFSSLFLAVSAPVSAEYVNDAKLFEQCSSAFTRSVEYVLGNSDNRIAYPHWRVERDGPNANVITRVEIGPVLRAELVCNFKNGKMLDASISNKTGGMTDYERVQQAYGEAIANARIAQPGLTEEEFIFQRIGEVQAEYSYIDRDGVLTHVQEYTGGGNHRVGPIRHEPTPWKQRISNSTYGTLEPEQKSFWRGFFEGIGIIPRN